MRLKGEKKQTLNINTVCTDKRIKQDNQIITVNIEVDSGVIPVKALSSPTTRSPITKRVSLSKQVHLGGLKLADSYKRNDMNISVLIGANHYFDFVTGETIKSSSGLTAVSSKLWWLLSGPVSYENDNSSCFNVNSNLVLDILSCRSEIVDENREIAAIH